MRRLMSFGIDLSLVAIATALAFGFRENFEVTVDTWTAFAPHLVMSVLAAAIIIPLLGLNRSVWRFTSLTDYLFVLAASILIVLASVIASFILNRLDGVARSIPIMQWILILLFLVGGRVFMRLRHSNRAKPPPQFSAVAPETLRPPSMLIVGLNRLTELYLQAAYEVHPRRIYVAGLIGNANHHTGRLVHRLPVLGTPEQLPEILKDLEVHGVVIDRILITAPWESLDVASQTALRNIEIQSDVRLMFLRETLGLDLPRALDDAIGPAATVAAQAYANAGQRFENRDCVDVLSVSPSERARLSRNPYWTVKRGLDVIAAFGLIILLSPLIAVAMLLVLVDVGRPVLFWQQRPGLGGRQFRLYKLRTMRAAHDEHGLRLADADRVSAVGRLIRAIRLDELPQLFQILAGQMSFVGPRPLLPADQPVGFAARLLVRPGLTGWAQVKGGRHLSASNKAALDVWYVRHASLLLDIQILLRTVVIVLFGERATDDEAIRKAWGNGL